MSLNNTLLGAQVTQVDTDGIARFEPGTRHTDESGTEYRYIRTDSALTQYYVYAFDSEWSDVAAATSATHGPQVRWLGVPQVAFAAPSGTTYNYGWVAVKGPMTVQACSGQPVNVQMFLTSNAGIVASYAAGLYQVESLVLTESVTHGAADAVGAFSADDLHSGDLVA